MPGTASEKNKRCLNINLRTRYVLVFTEKRILLYQTKLKLKKKKIKSIIISFFTN